MKYILLFSFLTGGIAQNYDWDDEKKMRGRRSTEKMENMIVWRLTDDLDLTTDQAEKFFPRFRDHRKILEEIGKQEREMIGNIDREKLNKNDVKMRIEEISKPAFMSQICMKKMKLRIEKGLSSLRLSIIGMPLNRAQIRMQRMAMEKRRKPLHNGGKT